MEVIVLAGGFGTRLQRMVPNLPKPMAPVSGRPFLEFLLSTLAAKGFDRVILSLGYMAETIVNHFGDTFAGMDLLYEIEQKPLGTGGALRRALVRCDSDHVFVLNGDTYLDLEVDEIDAQWRREHVPIIVTREVPDTTRYGRLNTFDRRVVGFVEKGFASRGLINAGCYVFPTDIAQHFPDAETFSLENDFLANSVGRIPFHFFVCRGYFIDIGVPEDYVRAQSSLASTRRALFLDRDGVINVDRGYVCKRDQFEFVEGIFDLCRSATNLGYLVIVVTNQAGIGRGYYSEQEFLVLTEWMHGAFRERGTQISKVYYCPFHPEHGVGIYKQDSPYRKPGPGMILQAAEEFNIDLTRSTLVGDKESDIQAGIAAGVHCNLLYIPRMDLYPPDPSTAASSTIRKLFDAMPFLNLQVSEETI